MTHGSSQPSLPTPRAAARLAVLGAPLLALLVLVACTSTTSGGAPGTTETGATSTSTSVPRSTTSSSSSTTSSSSSTTSTSTTAPPVTVNTAVLPDVVAAAALGPVPDGTPVRGASGDRAAVYDSGCHASWNVTQPRRDCFYGDPNSDVVIAVTGDSEAAHWFGAFDEAGKANHWKILMITKSGCPAADVPVHSAANTKVSGVPYPECPKWRANAMAYIAELHPRLVVFPMLSRRSVVGTPKALAMPVWAAGLGRSIDAVKADGTDVLVLGDTPKTNGQNIPVCVAEHRDDVAPCGNSREKAVDPTHVEGLAAAAAEHGASFVDPANWFCTDTFCPAVIGTSVVYRDDNHLTDRFSRTRAQQVAEAVLYALEGPQH